MRKSERTTRVVGAKMQGGHTEARGSARKAYPSQAEYFPAQSEPKKIDQRKKIDHRTKLRKFSRRGMAADAAGPESHPGRGSGFEPISQGGSAATPPMNLRTQVRELLRLSLPVILAYLLQFLNFSLPFFFLGRISAEAMGASVLANMFVNCTGNAIGFGFVTALDTLASQAMGTQNYAMVGLVTQRCIVLMSLFCIPMSLIWFFVPGPLFATLGVDPEVTRLAALYAKVWALGIWPNYMFEIMKKYLANQGITTPPLWSMIPALLVNFSLNYILVPSLGFVGAPLALVFGIWVMCIVLFVYIRWRGLHKKTWPEGGWRGTGWDRRCLAQWGPLVRLGAPGASMLVLEWGTFELNAFIAAQLGPNPLATHSILSQTAGFFFMTPLGMNVALTTVVGNSLGEGRPILAYRFVKLGLAVASVVILAQNLVICIGIPRQWVTVFTQDEDVVNMAAGVLPWFTLFAIPDNVQGVLQGALKGMGRQKLGAAINVFCMPVMTLPMAWLFGITLKHGITGVWLGMATGMVAVTIAFGVYIGCIADWKRESELAIERTGASETPMSKELEFVRVQTGADVDDIKEVGLQDAKELNDIPDDEETQALGGSNSLSSAAVRRKMAEKADPTSFELGELGAGEGSDDDELGLSDDFSS